ncbi:unnamed protein product, partial [Urochloa humidicola]
ETETPDQGEVEPESEPVADDASFVNQGEMFSEPVFGYFMPADGGAGEE